MLPPLNFFLSFRGASKTRTRNLEIIVLNYFWIPGLVLRTIPE